jgi:hypothetical protein
VKKLILIIIISYLDVNIEHVEFLMFIFHQLPFISRKMLLIRICQILIEITNTIENM